MKAKKKAWPGKRQANVSSLFILVLVSANIPMLTVHIIESLEVRGQPNYEFISIVAFFLVANITIFLFTYNSIAKTIKSASQCTKEPESTELHKENV